MASPMFDLSSKRAVVVGAASGIGRQAALALAAHGAEVVFADRDLAGAESAATEAADSAIARSPAPATGAAGAPPPAGARSPAAATVRAFALDVLDDQAVAAAPGALGPVDILVFTAATNVRKRILDYRLDELDRVVALNLRASFHLIASFGRAMCARGTGSIIAFSSIRAVTVEPGQAVYAATKAGLVQLVRTAAVEMGPAGVRVNAVSPGVVETPLTAQIRRDPAWYGAYAAKTALGRWARADELAGAVVYLASDASSYVTGSVLTVDGGWTAIDGRYEPPSM
ncbi:MAG: SDR family NAD(P)-dependent oxidoreductase [Acidimicrobiales bacterium]